MSISYALVMEFRPQTSISLALLINLAHQLIDYGIIDRWKGSQLSKHVAPRALATGPLGTQRLQPPEVGEADQCGQGLPALVDQ